MHCSYLLPENSCQEQSWCTAPPTVPLDLKTVFTAKPHFPWGCLEPITEHGRDTSASAFLPDIGCFQQATCPWDSPSAWLTFLGTVLQFEMFYPMLPSLFPLTDVRPALWSHCYLFLLPLLYLSQGFLHIWACLILSWCLVLGGRKMIFTSMLNVVHLSER